jgi:hypothetical protein
MNRRGVLGMLGIGAAAGPAIAKESIYKTMPSMYSIPSTAGTIGSQYCDNVPERENPLDTLKHVRERYNRLTMDKTKWIAEYMQRETREAFRYGNHGAIDPDIMAMKSFSHGAKLRLHIQRRAEYRYNEELLEAMSSVEYWMKEAGL